MVLAGMMTLENTVTCNYPVSLLLDLFRSLTSNLIEINVSIKILFNVEMNSASWD